ncbi:hypothetical protein GGF45_004281 [Coemansia sp. RSA 551]|nr:hypothetical protein GGF45_004281 [Coemansia sp. RSA 551]
MDAIANDVPSSESALQVYGFPTIVFIRGEDNAIVEYTGNRSLESLVEFIEENAATKITYNKDDLKDHDDDDEADEDEEAEEAEVEPKAEEVKADAEEAKDEPKAEEAKDEVSEEPEAEKEEAKGSHDEL